MPDINSIADKLALLATEISNIKTEINRTHPGWATPEQNMSDIADDVDEMFIGFNGVYQAREESSGNININAYVEYPVIIDCMFAYWTGLNTVKLINDGFNDITRFGDGAFKECTSFKGTFRNMNAGVSLSGLPSNLEYIGDEAFYNCRNYELSSFSPSSSKVKYIGNYAFNGCYSSNFKVTSLPASVEYIGDCAFAGCSNAYFKNNYNGSTGANKFPQNLKHIGSYPFKNMKSGSSAMYGPLPPTLEYVGEGAFANLNTYDIKQANICRFGSAYTSGSSYTGSDFPLNLKFIGKQAFYDNGTYLKIKGNMIAQNDQTPIIVGYQAFYNCNNAGMTMGGDVRGLVYAGEGAFSGCSNITLSGIFPLKYVDSDYNQIDDIPREVFKNCSNITFSQTTLNVPNIGSEAFYGCSSIEIDESITADSIGYSSFYGCTSLTINDSISVTGSIGSSAFYNCTNIAIDDNGTGKGMINAGSIGDSAFENCESLVIPDSITVTGSIGNSAFYNCISLESPNGIFAKTSIGSWAFRISDDLINNNQSGSLGPTKIQVSDTTAGQTVSIGQHAFRNNDLYTTEDVEIISASDGRINIGAFARTNLSDLTLKFSTTSQYGYLTIDDAYDGSGNNLGAFQESNLSSITMVGNINTIGSYTFYKCSNLSDVTFSQTPTSIAIRKSAFEQCNFGDTTLTIPSNVTSLGVRAFCNSKIKNLVINGAITTCGDYAFADNFHSTQPQQYSLTLNEGIVKLGNYCFSSTQMPDYPNHATETELSGTITLPTSLTTFGDYVFGLSDIENILFPQNITKIGIIAGGINTYEIYRYGDMVYKSYINLLSVSIPNTNTLKILGGFDGFHNLSGTYTIPNGVEEFGTLQCCDHVTGISIPNTVKKFGVYKETSSHAMFPFLCTAIEEVTFPASITHLGKAMFSWIGLGYFYPDRVTRYFKRIKIQSDCLPEPFTYGGSNYGLFTSNCCTESIELSNITKIPAYTFKSISVSNTGTTIKFTDSNITRIEQYAFDNAWLIPETIINGKHVLEIPDSIKFVGDCAFCNVVDFDVMFTGNPTDLNISSTAFAGNGSAFHLYVPWAEGTVANAPWGLDPSQITYGYTPSP